MKKLEEQLGSLVLLESNFESAIKPLPLKEEDSGKYSGAWKCPIWNIGQLNLNGRVYTQDLADRLLTLNKVTPVCDGHEPDYHHEYKNYIAVAKEPWIEGSVFGCNVYVIDSQYQEKIAKLNSLGLPIGVSSVGYGECDQDGVVNAASYELVRYMDFVTYPAGQVYAKPISKGNSSSSADEKNEESADLSQAQMEAMAELNKLLSMED